MSWVIKIDSHTTYQTVKVEGKLNLAFLQEHVGGLIEVCIKAQFDSVTLVGLCDEEGLLKGLPPTLMSPTQPTPICGNILWVVEEGEDFLPMSNSVRDKAVKMIRQWGFVKRVVH